MMTGDHVIVTMMLKVATKMVKTRKEDLTTGRAMETPKATTMAIVKEGTTINNGRVITVIVTEQIMTVAKEATTIQTDRMTIPTDHTTTRTGRIIVTDRTTTPIGRIIVTDHMTTPTGRTTARIDHTTTRIDRMTAQPKAVS